MPELPDFTKSWDYENGFYLTSKPPRFAKLFAQYELFKMAAEVDGDIVECGVFKGASFARFAMFRQLFLPETSKRLIGFDTFGSFPPTKNEEDQEPLLEFTSRAGDQSLRLDQMHEVLERSGCHQDVELVKGNIIQTVPRYCALNPSLRISMLNLDTDVYEPAVTILEHLYPRIVSGGVLVLDDYGVFPGETRAVDEYFADQPEVQVRQLPFAKTPCYVVKP